MIAFRDLLQGVTAYVPGEQPRGGYIKLNTNENPYPPSPKVLQAIRGLDGAALARYPDPAATELRRELARFTEAPDQSWVIAGNGMDEILGMLLRAFVDPGDTVFSVDPTYTYYEGITKLHGANYVTFPLDKSFALTDEFFRQQGRLCYLPRPNAPSGVCAEKSAVRKFCTEFNGLVVIDEAYADFAGDNCLDLVQEFSNVVVTRTFSKSFSLAGLRLGAAIAQPAIIAELFKAKDSYNVNVVSQAAGVAALRDLGYMRGSAAKIRTTRARLRDGLLALGFSVPESQANFVLAGWRDAASAEKLYRQLKDRKVLVRYFAQPRIDHCIRISVGTDAEIDALFLALGELIP